MIKLFYVLLILFFCWSISYAERLVCDVPTDPPNISACEVRLDTITMTDPSGNSLCSIDPGPNHPVIRLYTDADGTWMELLDEPNMVGIPPGRHLFEARVMDVSGWWSDWSGPLNAGKPAALGGKRIVK